MVKLFSGTNYIHLKHGFVKQKILKRTFAQFKKPQDPRIVENMPIFDYIPENSKRSLRVYLWGNAEFGALGKSSFVIPQHENRKYRSPLKTLHKPWRHFISERHDVRDIACGYGFTVFAAVNKEVDYSVFGTGLNSDGQIGYQRSRKGKPLIIVAEPVPILLPLLNSSTKATKVACGRAHTIIVTDKEGIFSLGNNAFGQCGTPHIVSEDGANVFKVHKVEGIDEEVAEVVCGQDHTLFLTTSGNVYSCGWSADGQTGLGHYKNQTVPAKVIGDINGEKIIKLSCAADCTLALSDKGEVFGWGNSEYGQLKLSNDQQQMNVSTRLKLNLGKIKDVASGGTMCGVVTDDGRVFVWGFGILGQGPEVTALKEPSLLPPPLFGYNEFSSDMAVEQLHCGLTHFAALTNKGHLYMWGKNKGNCLGLGRLGDQFFPFRVAVPACVLKVSCGVDHTAVICRPFT